MTHETPHSESRVKSKAKTVGRTAVSLGFLTEVSADETPASRVRHSVTPAPVSRVRHGRRPTPEVAEEVDHSMNFADWQPDAAPESRSASYASEFVRRLVDGEVVEYGKCDDTRYVTGAKYNDDGTLKFLKIGFRTREDGPIYNSSIAPDTLIIKIAEEPGLFFVPRPVPTADSAS